MTNVQERSRTRRQRVLDAHSRSSPSTASYSDTAIDEIARASDTSKGGLYFHFPSKQALFLALLDEASGRCCDASKSRWSKSPIPFRGGDACAVHAFAGHRLLARLLLVEALGAGKNSTRSSMNCTRRLPHSLPTASMPRSPRDRFHQLIRGWRRTLGTAVNHVVLRWLLNGEPARLEETYPQLRALLLYGVTGAGGERRR